MAFLLASVPLAGTPRPQDSGTPLIPYGIVVGQAVVDAAGTATIDISLIAAEQPITAVQFDIQYPTTALGLTVTAGSALNGAQKSLLTANPKPGSIRILITGLNQTPIPGGTLATLSVQTAVGNAPGLYPLQISGVLGSSAAGEAVYLFSSSGGINVPGPVVFAVANGASYTQTAVAPGEIVVIGGDSLGLAHNQYDSMDLRWSSRDAPGHDSAAI